MRHAGIHSSPPTSLCGCTVPVPSSFSLSRALCLPPSSSPHPLLQPRILRRPGWMPEVGSHQTPRLSLSRPLSLPFSPSLSLSLSPSLPPPLVRAFSLVVESVVDIQSLNLEIPRLAGRARGWPLDSWPSVTLRGWLDRSASSRESRSAPPLLSVSLSLSNEAQSSGRAEAALQSLLLQGYLAWGLVL